MAEQIRVQRLRNAGLLAIALHNLLDSACRAVAPSLVLARSRGFEGYVNRKSFKINPSA